MKNIILSIATVIITFGAYAQSESSSKLGNQSNNKYYADTENLNPPDGFMFQDGKMLRVKNGTTTEVKNDTTLSNGTIIMSDGHYMKKDESKIMFKEGEHMDMAGEITSVDNSSYIDGTANKNHPNGYIFQDGELMKVKNGKMTPLDVDIKLINGTAIMKNGYYMKEGEQKMKFKEGEHIDMSGSITQTDINMKMDEHNKQQNKNHPLPNSPKNDDY